MQHLSNGSLVLSLALLAQFADAVTGFAGAAEQPARSERPVREYREHALRNEGVPERGRALFNNQRTQCFPCHSTDGKGGKTGPDLYAAGDKYSRSDLIRSVLEPSATIMMGYSTTVLETLKGDRIEGVLKSVSDSELVLAGLGSVTQRVAGPRSRNSGRVRSR